MNGSGIWNGRATAALALVVFLGALLLLWRLGTPYLWQDEAATAVLSQRMLRFGRPLAYDGVNLITIDNFAAEDSSTIDQRTADAQSAINFYVRRGDFKADTSWRWQPWGQFVITALSFKLFGAKTLSARLPFALAGIASVICLYWFVLKYFRNWQIAFLSCGFLVLNGYWDLHCRQCRYYSLSSLFLILTLGSYASWQSGRRWGAGAFIIAAWCWFQVDYGTVWPVLAVLFTDSLIAVTSNLEGNVLIHQPRRTRSITKDKAQANLLGVTFVPFVVNSGHHYLGRTAMVGGILGVAIAPFAYYYGLWSRLSAPIGTWHQRFVQHVLNVNAFVLPFVILIAAVVILIYRWRILFPLERRLVSIICAILGLLLFWLPTVTPAAFLRYSIMLAPIGCLIVAWVLVRGIRSSSLTWIAAAIFAFTPWFSLPFVLLEPAGQRHVTLLRPELGPLRQRLIGHQLDPNGAVIQWLKQNARPDAEILINYEDVPLMFYLPNPIRGGVAAFRAEDDGKRPPDFIVLRKSVDFVHWPVYWREMKRHQWAPATLYVPDVPWGNNPEMIRKHDAHTPSIFIARRVSQ